MLIAYEGFILPWLGWFSSSGISVLVEDPSHSSMCPSLFITFSSYTIFILLIELDLSSDWPFVRFRICKGFLVNVCHKHLGVFETYLNLKTNEATTQNLQHRLKGAWSNRVAIDASCIQIPLRNASVVPYERATGCFRRRSSGLQIQSRPQSSPLLQLLAAIS